MYLFFSFIVCAVLGCIFFCLLSVRDSMSANHVCGDVRLYCAFSGLGDSTSVMFCGSFHASAMYLTCTGQQSRTYLSHMSGRKRVGDDRNTHLVWLPLATSSSCSFVKRMEVYARVLPTVVAHSISIGIISISTSMSLYG